MSGTTIHLTDNCREGRSLQGEEARTALQLAHLDLLEDHHDLMVLPQLADSHAAGLADQPILTVNRCRFAPDGQCLSLSACTGNVMGFVGLNGTSVSIHSRFARGEKDFFLYYMLQQVFGVNVVRLLHGSNRSDQVMDFLLCLFPQRLKQALAQGLMKAYTTVLHDDAHVRGSIDVARFIRHDVPFRGRVSTRRREQSHDHAVTQLIRHTIECIRRHPLGPSLLNGDASTREAVTRIVECTPSYDLRQRPQVMADNLRPKVHPYYLNYLPLQELCLRILRHESLRYGDEEQQIYGILFDGSWLWEEYLHTILRRQGFLHPDNRRGTGGLPLFATPSAPARGAEAFDRNARRIFPDFYRHDWVVDAKYKRLNGCPGRDDIYQLVSYLYGMDRPFGAFVYPDEGAYPTRTFQLAGKGLAYAPGQGGTLSVIPFHIPHDVLDWPSFVMAMEQEEAALAGMFG